MEKENEKKIDNRQDQQEEEDDEMEKMEQFYYLIRHFREARDRLIKSRKTQPKLPNHEVGDHEEEAPDKMKTSKRRKKTGEEDGDHHQGRSSSTSWVPSFEREDFADKEVEFQGTSPSGDFPAIPWNTTANSTVINKHQGKEKLQDGDDASDQCLDLRLAL